MEVEVKGYKLLTTECGVCVCVCVCVCLKHPFHSVFHLAFYRERRKGFQDLNMA